MSDPKEWEWPTIESIRAGTESNKKQAQDALDAEVNSCSECWLLHILEALKEAAKAESGNNVLIIDGPTQFTYHIVSLSQRKVIDFLYQTYEKGLVVRINNTTAAYCGYSLTIQWDSPL